MFYCWENITGAIIYTFFLNLRSWLHINSSWTIGSLRLQQKAHDLHNIPPLDDKVIPKVSLLQTLIQRKSLKLFLYSYSVIFNILKRRMSKWNILRLFIHVAKISYWDCLYIYNLSVFWCSCSPLNYISYDSQNGTSLLLF